MTPVDYKDNFHNVHFQESLNSAKEVVPLFLRYFEAKTVLDVGCGLGTWLKIFEENNCDIFGVDGDYVKVEDLIIDRNKFLDYDLNLNLNLKKKFDLVTSLEVAEHILPENARNFIDSLCLHGDIVLFSAAIPGQEGTLHFNEQYNEYWVNLFAQNNFECIDFLRHEIWNNQKISWWYRQNILIFIKKDELVNNIYDLIPKDKFRNTYIHPELFAYKCMKADKLPLAAKGSTSPKKYLKRIIKRLVSKL